MATELVAIIGGVVLVAALAVEGFVFAWMMRATLEFLRENMQVGGTPLAVMRAQAEQVAANQKAENTRREELRAYQRASISD